MIKKRAKLGLIVMSLIGLGVISGCSATLLLLKFQDRSYEICEDKPGLCYPHCKDRTIFGRCKQWDDGFIDLNNQSNRSRFRTAEFICKQEKDLE